MEQWLKSTAWPMIAPVPYSAFHILITLTGLSAAIFAAWNLRTHNEKRYLHTLLFCGSALALSEIYKQLFLFYAVNDGRYDWWYFPFQLCSLPMYLCLILPLVRSSSVRRVLSTFMQDFHLLGGIMALAEPSGLMHPYWILTLHGFLWHFMLVFIGLFIGLGGWSDFSIKGYLRTLPLFGACCLIASVINVSAHTLGDANMFYISPYYPSSQAVFHQIAARLGILGGNICYLLSICLGGFICHLVFRLVLSRFVDKSIGE